MKRVPRQKHFSVRDSACGNLKPDGLTLGWILWMRCRLEMSSKLSLVLQFREACLHRLTLLLLKSEMSLSCSSRKVAKYNQGVFFYAIPN